MWSVLLPAPLVSDPCDKMTLPSPFPLCLPQNKKHSVCQGRDAIIFTQAILFSVPAQHSVSAVTQTVVAEFPIEGETVSVLGGKMANPKAVCAKNVGSVKHKIA